MHHWVTGAWQRTGRPGRLLKAAQSTDHVARFAPYYEQWGVYMTDARPAGIPADQLTVHLALGGSELDRKLAALAAMASQTSELMRAVGPELFAEESAEEFFIEAGWADQPPAIATSIALDSSS